jgi:hypothetical protein
MVTLRKDRKGRQAYVHQLVLETFVGPCPPGMQCRHFPDQSTKNNYLSNLAWGTQSENEQDKKVHGTFDSNRNNGPRGEAVNTAKLTIERVRQLRAMHAAGTSIAVLAKTAGVSWTAMADMVKRKTWKHV